MTVDMYIPYINSDAVDGFKTDRKITAKEYVKEQETEWKECRKGVNTMMPKLGENIAINMYDKRECNVDNMKYSFFRIKAMLYDLDEQPLTVTKLDEIYRQNKETKEQFMLFVFLDPQMVKKDPDLTSDLRQWFDESMKLWDLFKSGEYEDIDEITVLKNLPTKDFKIHIKEDNSTAVLKKCKFIEPTEEPYSGVFMIEQILFIKET